MKFVFDLDGTICFKGKPLSKEMVHALDYCVANGHEIIFASARPIRDMLPVLPTHMHGFSMIGGNGTFVAKDRSIVNVTSLDEATMSMLRSFIEKYKLQYLVDGRWHYAYTGSKNRPIFQNIDPDKLAENKPLHTIGEIVKMVLFPGDYKEVLLEQLYQLPVKIYEYEEEGILDIGPIGIDKWHGLQQLHIEDGNYIAFGNDVNDISMLTHAKIGVCIGEHEILSSVASINVHSDEKAVIDKIVELTEVNSVHMQKG